MKMSKLCNIYFYGWVIGRCFPPDISGQHFYQVSIKPCTNMYNLLSNLKIKAVVGKQNCLKDIRPKKKPGFIQVCKLGFKIYLQGRSENIGYFLYLGVS